MVLNQLLRPLFLWQALWRRCRRCLLKGCQAAFRAKHPLSRYCSSACRTAARRWSRWWAARRYRASPHGKTRRAAQAQRRRTRLREQHVTSAGSPSNSADAPSHAAAAIAVASRQSAEVSASHQSAASASHLASNSTATITTTSTTTDAPAAACLSRSMSLSSLAILARLSGGEGHQDRAGGKKSFCHRPGCYESFAVPKRSPLKKFCDPCCRQALRCVRERERRLRALANS